MFLLIEGKFVVLSVYPAGDMTLRLELFVRGSPHFTNLRRDNAKDNDDRRREHSFR